MVPETEPLKDRRDPIDCAVVKDNSKRWTGVEVGMRIGINVMV